MQGLLWRLRALDPEATETLKVISYFDALVNHHASTEAMLKGSAALGGCVAGFTLDGKTIRVDPAGTRLSPVSIQPRISTPVGITGIAWLEREGQGFVNDPMILERLSLALTIAHDRTSPRAATARAIETVTDSITPEEQRIDAARQLRLDPGTLYRVHATPMTNPVDGLHTVRHTDAGPIRISIHPHSTQPGSGRIGAGLARPPHDLPRSWTTALLALRLTTDAVPQQTADNLGGLLVLAEAALPPENEPPDVQVIRALSVTARDMELLQALTLHHSLRSVATQLGLHHSTVQARVKDLDRALGFDPTTATGRVRLTLALVLHRLTTTRFPT